MDDGVTIADDNKDVGDGIMEDGVGVILEGATTVESKKLEH